MALFYVTGISGAGKSEVRDELARRGYEAHGTDEDGVAAFFDRSTGEVVTRPDNPEDRTPAWRKKTVWKIRRDKIEELASQAKGKPIFLCGAVENDDEVWDLFDKVVALVLDEETLEDRIKNRPNNNYGKNPHELAEVLEWQKTAEDDYRGLGATIIDATQPIEKVVDKVIEATRN